LRLRGLTVKRRAATDGEEAAPSAAESQVSPPGGDMEALLERVDELQRSSAGSPGEHLSELVLTRHRAGAAMLAGAAAPGPYPEPDGELPPAGPAGLPDLSAAELTPGLLRSAILRDGCALVRELVPRERAAALAERVDRLFGDDPGPGYREFVPDPPWGMVERPWVRASGGIWLADAPEVLGELLGLYDQVGVRQLISGYLGSRPLLSVNKSTLRRGHAETANIDWHQDGAFMGEVRTLNLWLSLSACGEDAPGLLLVPRRIGHIVETGTPGARFEWSVSPTLAEAEAGPSGPLHPRFAPGDAMLFDNFFLHATWVQSDMPKTRYAVETWFFNPATFPDAYVPLAV
jgi:hypothetical protein